MVWMEDFNKWSLLYSVSTFTIILRSLHNRAFLGRKSFEAQKFPLAIRNRVDPGQWFSIVLKGRSGALTVAI
jgi:hypothetical protein